MNFEAEVIALMREHQLPELPVGHPIFNSKKVLRFGPKKKGWYSLRKFTLKSGKEVVAGYFGINRGSNHNTVPVRIESEKFSAQDVAEYAERQRAFEEKAAADRANAARLASNRAKGQWAAASEEGAGTHPYLVRKGVVAEGLRVDGEGQLLIPMRHYSLEGARLVGLQKISPAGEKRYNKGLDKIGAGFLLGNAIDASIIATGEGYATCQSARMGAALCETYSHDLPVMVAFDAGNIIHIARKLRADFPKAHLLFLADDDFQLELRYEERLREDFGIDPVPAIDGEWRKVKTARGDLAEICAEYRFDRQAVAFLHVEIRCGRVLKEIRFENAGLAACHAAAFEVGNASVVKPLFRDRVGEKLTDFNDLHQAEGLEAVSQQICAAIVEAIAPEVPTPGAVAPGPRLSLVPRSPEERNRSGASAPEDQKQGKSKGGSAPGESGEASGAGGGRGGGGKGKSKGDGDEPDPEYLEKWRYLVDNFVLLYGTSTAWDRVSKMQIEITALRLAYGNDVVKGWLNTKRRQMINIKNLVFDPTETVDEVTHVNMYDGFDVVPKKGRCEKILELLKHLCNNDELMFAWVLKWIAYPLQHPGAKMATAIIMHGDEGSGKNLFWEKVVRQIYGQYSWVIGDAELESPFNEWASRKLFLVCDEVVTRNELKQLKGRMKKMISGDELPINPKNLSVRYEANHMNFVFLSNELQPLALDKTDRRYLVLWTPPKREKEFYAEVGLELEDGGMEAFFHYLRYEVDLAGFTPHTEPIMNQAKQNLISLGLSPSERFYREWEDQALPVPFMTCSSQQLYSAFQRWCTLNGERYTPTKTRFGSEVKRIAGAALRDQVVKYEFGEAYKQRTVYLLGEPKEDQSLQDYVKNACDMFEKDLRRYRHVYDQPEELTVNPSHG